MDPSNFGSSSSGGNSGSAGVSGVSGGGVTVGTNSATGSLQANTGRAQGLSAQPVRPVMPGVAQPSRMAQPSMQRPMQFQPQMVASNMDDVMLSGGVEPKKSKKGLVVGIVIMVLALVGIGVGAMLFSKKNAADEVLRIKDSFNVYANYLLFGNAVDDAINVELGDAKGGTYALDCEDKTQAECKEFFGEAKELLDNFKNSNYKERLPEESILNIENYFSVFDRYYTYINFDVMDDESILARYVSDGYDGAVTYVENYYSDLMNNEDSFLANYGSYEIERVKLALDSVRELDQAGCIVGGQYGQDCAGTFEYSESINDRTLSFIDGIGGVTSGSIYGARDSLLYETISVSGLLLGNGENNEEN